MLYTTMHNRVLRLVLAVLGELIAAAALNLFIVPLSLYTGGLMGLCQLIRTLLQAQLGLELGEYDLELFRERMAAVKEKRAALEKKEAELEHALREIQCSNPALLAEKIHAVLDAYSTADAAGKNALLKSVLESVWYKKEKKTKPADFQLQFVLRAL